MERSQLFDLMGELQLYGMKARLRRDDGSRQARPADRLARATITMRRARRSVTPTASSAVLRLKR
jgi:hypothetical protein